MTLALSLYSKSVQLNSIYLYQHLFHSKLCVDAWDKPRPGALYQVLHEHGAVVELGTVLSTFGTSGAEGGQQGTHHWLEPGTWRHYPPVPPRSAAAAWTLVLESTWPLAPWTKQKVTQSEQHQQRNTRLTSSFRSCDQISRSTNTVDQNLTSLEMNHANASLQPMWLTHTSFSILLGCLAIKYCHTG